MILAKDIVLPNKSILFKAGLVLTDETINILNKKAGNIPISIYAESDIVNDYNKNSIPNSMQASKDFDLSVDKTLSMILHHDEVMAIANVIKKIYRSKIIGK